MNSLRDLASGGAVLARLVDFGRYLGENGLPVSSARMIDATRAVLHLHVGDGSLFRRALRASFASNPAEWRAFDPLFDSFWLDVPPLPPPPDGQSQDRPEGREDASVLGHEEHGVPEQCGRTDRDQVRALLDDWEAPSPALRLAVRHMVRRLANRSSRRAYAARDGRMPDLRRTLRRSGGRGLDLHDPVWRRPKLSQVRLVVLWDVSGSMDQHTTLLLQLLVALHRIAPRSRSVVFSTRTTEITGALRDPSPDRALAQIAALARHWSGGTDIGGALRALNCGMLPDGHRSTTVFIVSDGFDRGSPRTLVREIARTRRRSRRVVWLNPLLQTAGYTPQARGMRAALPYIDDFLPIGDAETLRKSLRSIGNTPGG